MKIAHLEEVMAKLSLEDTIGDRSPGRLLRRINKLLEKRIQTRFSDSEISFEEWMALKLIYDGIVTTAGDLAKDIGIATGATTRLIDSLEKQGFVERDRTQADRRMVLLKITPAGRNRYRGKLPIMMDSWNEILEEFDMSEVEMLITLLDKLLNSFINNSRSLNKGS
jgi:DNA-binding MarR family transcriptional regulator